MRTIILFVFCALFEQDLSAQIGLRSPSFVSSLHTSAAAPPSIFDNTIHYWRMDDFDMDMTLDVKGGQTLNFVISNGTIDAPGKHNIAFSTFGEPSSEMDTDAFSLSPPFSVTFWLYLYSHPCDGGVAGSGDLIVKDSSIEIEILDGAIYYGSAGAYMNVGGGTLSEDVWHFVVVTTDASNDSISVDGAVFTSAARVSSPTTSGVFSVGTNGFADLGATLDAKIDELAIWNISLTLGNVTTLYNVGAGDFY